MYFNRSVFNDAGQKLGDVFFDSRCMPATVAAAASAPAAAAAAVAARSVIEA